MHLFAQRELEMGAFTFPHCRQCYQFLLHVDTNTVTSQFNLAIPAANHKQPSRGLLRKKRSENMQQIYRRTPMPKCNFNKVAQCTLVWVFSCKFCIFSERFFLRRPLDGCLRCLCFSANVDTWNGLLKSLQTVYRRISHSKKNQFQMLGRNLYWSRNWGNIHA